MCLGQRTEVSCKPYGVHVSIQPECVGWSMVVRGETLRGQCLPLAGKCEGGQGRASLRTVAQQCDTQQVGIISCERAQWQEHMLGMMALVQQALALLEQLQHSSLQ